MSHVDYTRHFPDYDLGAAIPCSRRGFSGFGQGISRFHFQGYSTNLGGEEGIG
ncbi:MAG: hypothetical protein ACKO9Z_18595 [Planctomycetota bacterium]